MKRYFRFITIAFFSASIIFSSCTKKDNVHPQGRQAQNNHVEEYASLEHDFNGMDQAIFEVHQANGNLRTGSFCYSMRVSSDTLNPIPGFETNYRKFILSFSGGDCDSIVRSGELHVYFSGSYRNRNYRDSVVFSGYSSNGMALNGYRTFKVNGSRTNLINYTVDLKYDISARLANGKTLSMQAQREKKYANYLASIFSHVEISGKGQGITIDGDLIMHEIKETVILKTGWNWGQRVPVKGVIVYKNMTTGTDVTIDYGDGSFNKKATIRNGSKVDIEIDIR